SQLVQTCYTFTTLTREARMIDNELGLNEAEDKSSGPELIDSAINLADAVIASPRVLAVSAVKALHGDTALPASAQDARQDRPVRRIFGSLVKPPTGRSC